MTEKTPELDTSVANLRAFVGRLETYEEGMVSDKDKSPLCGLEGAFLNKYEIANLFRETLRTEVGITNQTIVWHLYNYYIEPRAAALMQARKDAAGSREKDVLVARDDAGEALVDEMKNIIGNLDQYGIDIEKQDVSRADLTYESESGEYDEYATLDTLLGDTDNVPDPFYVNGMLPDPEMIKNACKRLYEKWYPNNKDDAHMARILIKEKCIDQVIRELQRVEWNKTKEKLNHTDKLKKIDEIVRKLTTLMRQIGQPEYAAHYTNLLALGPYQSEVSFPDDLLMLPTVTNRPPYNESVALPPGKEKTQYLVDFFREVYKNLPKTDRTIALQEFDAESNDFFRDEAGPIDSTNAYAKLEMIFWLKGFTEEQIQNSCAAYIAEIVGKIVAFDKEYTELHAKRGEKITHEELVELNKRIKVMKNNKRGQLRKSLLTEAKKIVEDKDIIDVMPIDSDGDNLKALAEAGNVVENEEKSIFYFDYSTLSDRDDFLDEVERFIKEVTDYALPYFKGDATNIIAVTDADFRTMRDTYGQQRTELTNLSDLPSEDNLKKLILGIEKNVSGMIVKIEAATSVREEGAEREKVA